MICQEVMELMQRYIDGDLDQQETSLMMDHAGQCPDCAAMLVRLQRLSNELEQLPRVVPKFSLVDAILPELDRLHAADSGGGILGDGKGSNEVTAISRSHRPSRHLFRNLSGVVAAGVVAGLLFFGNPGQWLIFGGSSHNDTAAPNESFAPAASADGPMLMRKSIDQSGTAQAPEVKMQDSAQLDGVTNYSVTEPSADAQNNAAAPDTGEKIKVTGTIDAKEGAKSPADNQDAISPSNPPMSISPSNPLKSTNSIPAEASVSKDGKWRAVAVEGTGTLQVFNTADESELFHSEVREGKISQLNWNEDSTVLFYTFTDTDGNQIQLQFSISELKESQR
jgi:hypothetical protein